MLRKFLPILLLLSAAPAMAQQTQPAASPSGQNRQTPQAATPQQISKFIANFQNGVTQGCLRTPPKDIPNPRSYCSCYAKAFIDRYKPNDLAVINNLAERYPQIAPATISVMMRPESLACAAR
ncbi:MAG: hypothetical protein NTU65_10740 [Cyanobacteria bacterium]|nr:hypothetical protein [Cyanobacteriota bacterium]